ncbi:hypothetical protein DY000_02034764 [Brassica cretica]|uniref:Trichome birefringence-like N-terminal domain-containing protein n=1 Tax=Brassica cretica TaxID=69181 RepID=A0ABQ7DNE3_BRACR|nr:hypothetical protein DY000_02034764 [Brassica cretica]
MSALQCLTFLFLFLLLQVATPASPLPLGRRRPVLDNSNHSNFAKHPRRAVFPVNRGSCDLFAGEWVRDETYPLYRAEECGGRMIDRGFDCQTYGRPDSDYLKFRWKPFNCDVPRLTKLTITSYSIRIVRTSLVILLLKEHLYRICLMSSSI